MGVSLWTTFNHTLSVLSLFSVLGELLVEEPPLFGGSLTSIPLSC